eukprot:NODE_130_length_16779_cov_1.687410.p13 type:complete len:175 gc:universal NODE_130_length_16779_cov_1.687410:3559-3035(-)
MEDELLKRFSAFCSFGSSRAINAVEIDNFKFSKLCKDSLILDKKLTTTDVDIVFNKAKKEKTDRKLDFEQFKAALRLLAEIKYPGDEEGYSKLVALVVKNEPKVRTETGSNKNLNGSGNELDSKASSDSVFDRLTDHTKYTGSHKERFDDDGKGKGLDGRRDGQVNHISEILRK